LSIGVNNAPSAIVPLIELRPVPVSVAGLAVGAELVAADINIPAGLAIGTTWHLSSTAPSAFELPVIVHYFSGAVVIVIE
jgi:hypothetical protein